MLPVKMPSDALINLWVNNKAYDMLKKYGLDARGNPVNPFPIMPTHKEEPIIVPVETVEKKEEQSITIPVIPTQPDRPVLETGQPKVRKKRPKYNCKTSKLIAVRVPNRLMDKLIKEKKNSSKSISSLIVSAIYHYIDEKEVENYERGN